MKLSEGIAGKIYAVEDAGLGLSLERRLEALGILRGTKLHVLNKKSHGALIIFVRGTRFAIGRSIAEHIQVEEVRE